MYSCAGGAAVSNGTSDLLCGLLNVPVSVFVKQSSIHAACVELETVAALGQLDWDCSMCARSQLS